MTGANELLKKAMASLSLIAVLTGCSYKLTKPPAANETTLYYSMSDFNSIKKYDTHVHFNVYDTSFLDQAKADNFRLLTINVNPTYYPPIEEQLRIGNLLIKQHPTDISFATTFTVNNWHDNDWQQKSLDYLKRSFDQGAIAVKVWKNIGMELRDKDGRFVMIDDQRFDPIFNYLAKNKIPLIGHLGEPKNCWLPVEQMTVSGDKGYFTRHPEYHMYLHPEYPSYEDQIKARNNVLEKHPDLKFIGAHLGSLEWSVDELAKHLDKYPNFAVDMAARIPHFQYQAVNNWQKVRDFMVKYQDRLIYATDLEVTSTPNTVERNKRAHERWIGHWEFFTSDANIKAPEVENEFRGLHLPRAVIDKIYKTNAERWFGGIANTKKANG
jgi:predicted TIM-barrel fold metal-dependent hydrolase